MTLVHRTTVTLEKLLVKCQLFFDEITNSLIGNGLSSLVENIDLLDGKGCMFDNQKAMLTVYTISVGDSVCGTISSNVYVESAKERLTLITEILLAKD